MNFYKIDSANTLADKITKMKSDFDEARSFLFVLPVDPGEDEDTACMVNNMERQYVHVEDNVTGLVWFLIYVARMLRGQVQVDWDYVTYDMAEHWNRPEKELFEIAERNIDIRTGSYTYGTLFDSSSVFTSVPYFRFAIKDSEPNVPFAASILFCDSLLYGLYAEYGELYLFPTRLNTVYFARRSDMEKKQRSPLASFREVLRRNNIKLGKDCKDYLTDHIYIYDAEGLKPYDLEKKENDYIRHFEDRYNIPFNQEYLPEYSDRIEFWDSIWDEIVPVREQLAKSALKSGVPDDLTAEVFGLSEAKVQEIKDDILKESEASKRSSSGGDSVKSLIT